MMNERTYRIVLAEDHTILREGLKALLASQVGLQVVGEATDGREAVRCAEELKPDLMMLDLSMPRSNGLEAMKDIKRVSPQTKVLVLTVHKTEDYVFTALQGGADGYVLKDSSAAELMLAIRSVLNGERYLAPAIASTVTVNSGLQLLSLSRSFQILPPVSGRLLAIGNLVNVLTGLSGVSTPIWGRPVIWPRIIWKAASLW